MKVKQFYNKNQFIIEGENKTVFQSYYSIIAEIDENGNLKLGRDWDYSNTTLKHLYLFLNDYFCELNENIKELLRYLNRETNKRKYIQKLIDTKKIEYDNNLK